MSEQLIALAVTLTAGLLLYVRLRFGELVSFKEYSAFVIAFTATASLWIAIGATYLLTL